MNPMGGPVPNTIDKERIQRHSVAPPSDETCAKEINGVVIQVTQAFCPEGHNLLFNEDELFDGARGISLYASDGQSEGEVILSPFHGDHRRKGKVDFEKGSELNISCPICKIPFERLSDCICPEKGELFKIYMTPNCNDSHVVALCNIWGCHRSKVFDQAQLLATYEQE
jgi:hypothetical protein